MSSIDPRTNWNPDAGFELMKATNSLFEEAREASARNLFAAELGLFFDDESSQHSYSHQFGDGEDDFVQFMTPYESSFTVATNNSEADFMYVDGQGTLRSLRVRTRASIRYLSLDETQEIEERLTARIPDLRLLRRALFTMTDMDFSQGRQDEVPYEDRIWTSYKGCSTFWDGWTTCSIRQFWDRSTFPC